LLEAVKPLPLLLLLAASLGIRNIFRKKIREINIVSTGKRRAFGLRNFRPLLHYILEINVRT